MQLKTTASFQMVQIDSGAITPLSKLCFCNWYCEAVCICQVNPLLTYSTQEAWFYLNGLVITPNNSYWSLTPQRAVLGDAGHSKNISCRAMTTTGRHAARSHSLHNISTTMRANVIGLLCAY
jgi:hypothetical protein